MDREKFKIQPEIVAAIISVVGTIVGTMLISVLLGFIEGRIGLGPVVAVMAFLLLLSIWVLLALRWGLRLAGATAAAMVVVGSAIFLLVVFAKAYLGISPPPAIPIAAVTITPTPTVPPQAATHITTPLGATATPVVIAPTEIPTITAPTPADQARAFAEPILAAIANRPPDFEDGFATADRGWDLVFPGKPPNGDRLEITDGVVRMTLFEGSEGMVGHVRLISKDFVLMVDSRQLSGSYDSAQMVVWGFPNGHWGQLAIQSGPPYWELSKGPGDQWPPGPKGSGDVVSPIGETNHILIVVRGPRLAIYLNDLPVAYIEDQDLDAPYGKELTFNCGGQADMVCEFDNVKLWNLENVPGLP